MEQKADPNIKSYIREKIKILEELCIFLSYEQLNHIWSLKKEIDVDHFARSIIWPKNL